MFISLSRVFVHLYQRSIYGPPNAFSFFLIRSLPELFVQMHIVARLQENIFGTLEFLCGRCQVFIYFRNMR